MTPFWGPEFGDCSWILGEFVDGCPERFRGAVRLLRGNFSDSNVAQLLLKPRTVPVDEVKHAWVLFMRLVSTFVVGRLLVKIPVRGGGNLTPHIVAENTWAWVF
jgi:hypothetical protein